MARAQRSMTPGVYQMKVTLRGSKPPIWRRFQVTSETTLAQLHRIVQHAMGWEGYHLYQFVVGGMEYGDPRLLEEMDGEDARRATPHPAFPSGPSRGPGTRKPLRLSRHPS